MKNKLLKDMTENLTLYFIFGNVENYKKFNSLVEIYCDYNVQNLRKQPIRNNNPIEFIKDKFNSARKDYESEELAVQEGIKYCYAFK